MAVLRSLDFMLQGLLFAGSSERQVSTSVPYAKKLSRFKSCFGSHPLVCAHVWVHLQNEGIDTEHNLERFFLTLFWLKGYATESVLSVKFDLEEETIRLWCWYYADCLQMLKEKLVIMPDVFDDVPFPLSVDGTHCTCYEPPHPEFPIDTAYWSHKHGTAAYNYQVALSTTESKILGVHGPYPAGANNDKIMFKESGLQELLVSQNKRAIADGGYEDIEGGGVAVPNRKYHSKLTNQYFRRLRARQETVNARLKNYAILSRTFRHKIDRQRKHKCVFDAVVAIVAVQITTKHPLFSV